MYNRYIPQSDGSYRRSSVPDPVAAKHSPEPQRAPVPQSEPPAPQGVPPAPECPPVVKPQPQRRCPNCRPVKPAPKNPEPSTLNVGSFLKKLLPRDFDTGDLLVVLLLLLMSTEECEDQSTALLTLALYLFL